MFKINNVELQFDLYELSVMKKYDELTNAAATATKEIFEMETLSSYEKMSAQMQAVRKVFDGLFGEGIGEKICGKSNVMIHISAYNELQMEADRMMNDYNKVCVEMRERTERNMAKSKSLKVTAEEKMKEQIPDSEAKSEMQEKNVDSGVADIINGAFGDGNSNQ